MTTRNTPRLQWHVSSGREELRRQVRRGRAFKAGISEVARAGVLELMTFNDEALRQLAKTVNVDDGKRGSFAIYVPQKEHVLQVSILSQRLAAARPDVHHNTLLAGAVAKALAQLDDDQFRQRVIEALHVAPEAPARLVTFRVAPEEAAVFDDLESKHRGDRQAALEEALAPLEAMTVHELQRRSRSLPPASATQPISVVRRDGVEELLSKLAAAFPDDLSAAIRIALHARLALARSP